MQNSMVNDPLKTPSPMTWSRVTVFILGGVETLAILLLTGFVIGSGQLTSGEALSQRLGWAIVQIYGIPYTICVLPALFLAAVNRWLPLALALCILVVPLTLFFFAFA